MIEIGKLDKKEKLEEIKEQRETELSLIDGRAID